MEEVGCKGDVAIFQYTCGVAVTSFGLFPVMATII